MAGILEGTDPLFNAGIGLLAGNQRSNVPVSPFASMQESLMQGQLLKRQQQQDQMKQQEYDLKMKRQQMLIDKANREQAWLSSQIPSSLIQTTPSPGAAGNNGDAATPLTAGVVGGEVGSMGAPQATQQQGGQYIGAIQDRLNKVTTALKDPSQFPDMATYNAYNKERIGLLEKLDSINKEADYSEVFTIPSTGQRVGWHNRNNRLEDVSTGKPFTQNIPTDVKSSQAVNQQRNQKKSDTLIGQSGYRTKKVNVNGIDYEQEVYKDVNGNEFVTSSRPVVESGFRVKGDEVEPQPGGTRDMKNPKNWSADMRKSSGFTNRMLMAENNINNVLNNAPDMDITDYAMSAYAGGGKLFGGLDQEMWNADMDKNQQQYVNSSMDWIRSKLRKESGAVISPEEMEGEYRTYFPIPGDSKEVITQKRKARMQATRNMQSEAAEAWTPDGAMGIPSPKSDAEFENLRPGSLFIDDDGKVYRKQ